MPLASADIERWLDHLFVAAAGASLRQEDRRKAVEVAAMLEEIRRALARVGRGRSPIVVDAAAGKTYVGLLTAKLLLEPLGRGEVIAIERDAARVASSASATRRLETSIPIDCRAADVSDLAAWPPAADVVVALHACGPAADVIISSTIAVGARQLLLCPCCTGATVPSAPLAASWAEHVGVPRQAPVRRRFIQAIVDAHRTLTLEAAGYETEVVELVPPTVTPHNLLWRCRRVGEPGRMAAAAARLRGLSSHCEQK